jgi:hypothetical protein
MRLALATLLRLAALAVFFFIMGPLLWTASRLDP